jgi:putative transposase
MQTTKRRSAEAWRAMVARFAQSGLTEAAFCEGEGISGKLFHRWRAKRVSGSKLEMRLDLGGGVLLHVVRG